MLYFLLLLQGNDKAKKKNVKAIELPMEISTHGFNPESLGNFTQQEVKMIANDQKETERIDAKNALEEFVYDARNKLQVIKQIIIYLYYIHTNLLSPHNPCRVDLLNVMLLSQNEKRL